MKKIFFFLLMALLIYSLHAQTPTTIFYNDYPSTSQVGEKFDVYFAGTVTINIGQLGKNTWNFSNVVMKTKSVAEMFTPSSTPYANLYPTANNALKVIDGDQILWFYGIGTPNTKLEYLGEAIQSTSLTLQFIYSPAMVTNFPVNYLDTWTYNGQETTRIAGTVDNTPMTVQYVVDAWGQLTLPGGKVVDALRILATENRNNGGSVDVTKNIRFITKGGDMIGIFLTPSSPVVGEITTGEFVWYSRPITNYTLNITSVNGTVTKNPNQESYTSGTTVQLTATPNPGYTFTGWSGDASGSQNPLTVTMNSNKNITANYSLNNYTLTVNSNNGTVAKNPDQASYTHGTTVQLTATPNPGYTFTNWSGDASGSQNPLTVTMNANKNITANYSLNTYTLTVNSTNGAVAKNPDQASYTHGANVQLTATPNSGYTFTNWSGDASGSQNPLTVTMNSNKNITANFSVVQYTVKTSSNPTNGGTTSGDGTYGAGSSVTIKAEAKNVTGAKFQFINWTENGVEVSKQSNYTFVINTNRTFVANFLDITSADDDNEIPAGFMLYQNYPNPFNPETKIKFGLPKTAYVQLLIYNSLGQEIYTLVNQELGKGMYELPFNAVDLPNGIYYYKIITADFVQTKKMTLIK